MVRAAIVTKDKYLAGLLRLDLEDMNYECSVFDDADECRDFSLIFYDTDSLPASHMPDGAIEISRAEQRGRGRFLHRPYLLSELRQAVTGGASGGLVIEDNSVLFGGESIRLTEYERRLLNELINAGGKFVSREKLLRSVWDGKASPGVVNVYIHYLRQKLERSGKKVIAASRNEGYRINPELLEEADNNA